MVATLAILSSTCAQLNRMQLNSSGGQDITKLTSKTILIPSADDCGMLLNRVVLGMP